AAFPLSENTDILFKPINCGGLELNNRIALQPMEGCDGTFEGAPDELTFARYKRFAEGGAALICLEAVAVLPQGRANPRQLHINENTLDEFKRLIDCIKSDSLNKTGYEAKVIMQATHSGRYSKPNGKPEPIIAYNNPIFEKDNPIDKSRIVSDDDLRRLEEAYGKATRLAEKAGFDGIDIKSCHRYLVSELLSAYDRPGEYGGSFENRTRLLRNGIAQAKNACSKNFVVTSRLNVYDGFPYPYGFGVKQDGSLAPDLDEPVKLVKMLCNDCGFKMLNITIGNPYVNPHVNRPYDQGGYVPAESPLTGVARMMHCVGTIKKAVPELCIIGSGFSYPKELSANLAAGALEEGVCDIAGFGREAFAYPDFVNDLKTTGKMDKKKCCITCGKCTELMRMGTVTGCVIRNPYYTELYKKMKEAVK
ncbi:MAG: NADH:flavin oxidoreductase, partial [Clostridia bacterium]|nr:NADH:flavin oxidoreductase [Clostridia bacterium]